MWSDTGPIVVAVLLAVGVWVAVAWIVWGDRHPPTPRPRHNRTLTIDLLAGIRRRRR